MAGEIHTFAKCLCVGKRDISNRYTENKPVKNVSIQLTQKCLVSSPKSIKISQFSSALNPEAARCPFPERMII